MLLNKINQKPIPGHIAIILDGNGRWAKKRGLPRKFGHFRGAQKLRNVARWANDLGVKHLTVYAFSTENWKRPQDEIDYLMTAPAEAFNKNQDDIVKSGIRIRFIGRRDRFPKIFLDSINNIENATKDNQGCILNICADYGSRDELTNAFKAIASKVKSNHIEVDDITEQTVNDHLLTYDMPDPDLLIRTSGEVRLSNFLLWQVSYSEMLFIRKHWPAFSKRDLHKAIYNYQSRGRRFGGLKEG